MSTYWLALSDAAEERNADMRAEAEAGRDSFGSGRWHAGAWQDDSDYEPGDER